EQYAKVQGLWHEDDREPVYSEKLELDLSQVVPSLAGPKRPQDRVPLSEAKECFRTALDDYTDDDYDIPKGRSDEASMESFPASDSPAVFNGSSEEDKPHGHDHTPMPGRPEKRVPITLDGQQVEIDHGIVAIAAITSCTNTSNPSVMVGAALVAKRAVELGLQGKPWGKTTLAPGSKGVMDYY